jgi:hypothetical protein
MAVDILAQFSAKSVDRILEPMDRISEILFGLIMALTFTLTLGVVQVQTMLLARFGAHGCQARSTNSATLEAYQGPCSRT